MTTKYPIRFCQAKKEMYAAFKKDSENSYYVYAHRRITDDKIFYIGKGKACRAWTTTGRNHYWFRVAKKHGCYVDIIFSGLKDQEAYDVEIDVIAELLYMGETLTNLTEGGEGGINPSAETRYKKSLARKGKTPYNKGVHDLSKRMELNPCADLTVYNFYHKDGETFTGTRYDLVRKYDLHLGNIGKLFYKGANRKKRIYGWSILEE